MLISISNLKIIITFEYKLLTLFFSRRIRILENAWKLFLLSIHDMKWAAIIQMYEIDSYASESMLV